MSDNISIIVAFLLYLLFMMAIGVYFFIIALIICPITSRWQKTWCLGNFHECRSFIYEEWLMLMGFLDLLIWLV